MNSTPKIHPKVAENHARTKAWNEYVIDHLGLRLQKECQSNYRAISVFQGSFCLYHNWTVNISKTTNAEMHRYLMQFLEDYLQHFQSFKGVAINPEFQPPKM